MGRPSGKSCEWCQRRSIWMGKRIVDVWIAGKRARVHEGECAEQLGKEAIAAHNENRAIKRPEYPR